ncbi:hypothetical protein SJI00_10885 [Pseudomonas sp. RP23018S]|uniref:hypothetical protein n=1 Tax=Pseudomonas sp. RP23018S TaxID=3096037 RepID=UPI002ACAC4C9|nr:hypothetical protein [Pseudomonas sp. RP23018S]MDZ5603279.1 hypothetical protein [Pseudomonas sp. RP23018S]
MKHQRGVVMLMCLVLSLLLGMLAASALRDALLETRLSGHLLRSVQAFEQAEAALLEAASQLPDSLPECEGCLPPPRPHALDGPWQRNACGYFMVQNLGLTERAAHVPAGESVRLFRITVVSEQRAARQVLEAVYAVAASGIGAPRRILWRQRFKEG